MRRAATLVTLASLVACMKELPFDADDPAVGPGRLVAVGAPLTDGHFAGGGDALPEPRQVTPPDDANPPDCDDACEAWCDAAALENPVNRGLCQSLWGVGLSPRPIVREEACRRLFIDLLGRLPTADELEKRCIGSWGEVARGLIADDAFVLVNQRRAADTFQYSTEVANVEAVYDLDALVAKVHRGLVPWDHFAQVVSAHPVIVRRHADARDKAEAVFRLLLGRPPFENERADMARLYGVWHQGHYEHPYLNLTVPDAYLRFPCANEDGEVDPERRGECASVLWGYHEVAFAPDLRAANDFAARELTMWHGLLSAEEWTRLQVPGRILTRQPAFWEHTVGVILEQYLGWDLASQVPEVRRALVEHLLRYDGDIRSVHHAVVTSVAYLQSHAGASTARYRWTWGPLKQVDAEVWLESISKLAGRPVASCDHRITDPWALVESGSLGAYQLLLKSSWRFDQDGELDDRIAQKARTLGGCPENVAGGRFHVVSILTTATQLEFVNELCNPLRLDDVAQAPVAALLPAGLNASHAVDGEVAARIATHQYRALLGRAPGDVELSEAQAAGEECARTRCSAEDFARPLCFALLSSSQQLFH